MLAVDVAAAAEVEDGEGATIYFKDYPVGADAEAVEVGAGAFDPVGECECIFMTELI